MFTIDVITAAALARHDRLSDKAPFDRLEFRLLAAASAATPRLPDQWMDSRHLMSVNLRQAGQDLHLDLQAIGFAAMSQFAGKAARIADENGVIDVRLKFDTQARASTTLANDPQIRRALVTFEVIVE